MTRLFDYFRTDDVPLVARTLLRQERLHMLLWGVFAGIVEGSTSVIVIAKTFGASELLVSVMFATPMLANMLSVLWGAIVRGRPRNPVYLVLTFAAAISFMSVALTPTGWGDTSSWLFILQIGLARIFLAGMITVRTSMWGANYPTALRARITGRLQGLRFLVGMVAAIVVALLFDKDADHYRWVYPLIGLTAILSLIPIRTMRVRFERTELRRFAQKVANQQERPATVLLSLREAWRILNTDKRFAQYCQAQFLLGSAVLMLQAILSVVLTKRLLRLQDDGWKPLNYWESTFLLDLLPQLVLLLTLPMWARLFDARGVVRFRVINSIVWLSSCVLLTIALASFEHAGYRATWLGAAFLLSSRIIDGLGRSGGAIAWNIGHLHFAGPHNADLYMGLHIALTGLRGVAMPFVGTGLLALLGWPAAAIACVIAVMGMRSFFKLAQADAAEAERVAALNQTARTA